MMKLYTYQKDLVNSKGKVYVNWSRGAGLTTALAHYILENTPEKVLCPKYDDRTEFYDLRHKLYELKNEYKFNVDTNFEDDTTVIKFAGKQITLYEDSDMEKHFDLYICKSDILLKPGQFREITGKPITSNTTLYVNRDNIHDRTDFTGYDSKSVVDIKETIANGQISLETLVDIISESGKSFYREYAILNEPKETKVKFNSFKELALQKLQKQFLDTSDTKDTVLTRKNIIEMIKDLQSIEVKQ